MSNAASPFWHDGRQFPSQGQLDEAIDAYERLSASVGDDPNTIADRMGWSRGTGCVIRRMAAERRAV